MKRKQAKTETVIPAEILEQAKRAISEDRLKKPAAPCAVCGSDTGVAGPEPLCWVCRRLKISAWRDIEQQAPLQE
jgi:hypothetical protein